MPDRLRLRVVLMSIRLPAFIRCDSCQKLHTRLFIGPNTVCACGANLYRKAWMP